MADKISELCKWIHEQLEPLKCIKYPFELKRLPQNGIYFFYENKEVWGHGGRKARIVRIGTHRGDGGFRRRLDNHFLLNESKIEFDVDQAPPSDRSIFRKNIGRVLLRNDKYLEIWNKKFTKVENRQKYRGQRNIQKEQEVEAEINEILRKKFRFRFIIVDSEDERKKLEKSLIGTIAQCDLCKPSKNWLGRLSPENKIIESGLWQTQHLKATVITKDDKQAILKAIKKAIKYHKY